MSGVAGFILARLMKMSMHEGLGSVWINLIKQLYWLSLDSVQGSVRPGRRVVALKAGPNETAPEIKCGHKL